MADIVQEAVEGFVSGTLAMTGSAIKLPAGLPPANKGIIFKADVGNAAVITLGNSIDVASGTGYVISQTDAPLMVPISNAGEFYFHGTNTDKLYYILV